MANAEEEGEARRSRSTLFVASFPPLDPHPPSSFQNELPFFFDYLRARMWNHGSSCTFR